MGVAAAVGRNVITTGTTGGGEATGIGVKATGGRAADGWGVDGKVVEGGTLGESAGGSVDEADGGAATGMGVTAVGGLVIG